MTYPSNPITTYSYLISTLLGIVTFTIYSYSHYIVTIACRGFQLICRLERFIIKLYSTQQNGYFNGRLDNL